MQFPVLEILHEASKALPTVRRPPRPGDASPARLLEALDQEADKILHVLLDQASDVLEKRRKANKLFCGRLFRKWEPALELLEIFLLAAHQMGHTFVSEYGERHNWRRIHLFHAMSHLHARSLQVGQEVLCLLKAGLADGAMGRWRTAHEIAVTALVLVKGGDKLARRYLEHEQITNYRAMVQFQEFADRLDEEPFSEQEVEEARKERDRLVAKYGRAFADPYGWAAEKLKQSKVTFAALERFVGLDHWRPYYKLSCDNVHSESRGILRRVGLPSDAEIILAGGSDFGLADPARCTAISIFHTSQALLLLEPDAEAIVSVYVLERLRHFVEEAFLHIRDAILEPLDAE